jgi:hypothetical protein
LTPILGRKSNGIDYYRYYSDIISGGDRRK